MDDDDEEGFVGYIPTTIDPGWPLLVGTIAFSIVIYMFLPCFVVWGGRYEKRRIKQKKALNTTPQESTEDDEVNQEEKHEDGVDENEGGVDDSAPSNQSNVMADKSHDGDVSDKPGSTTGHEKTPPSAADGTNYIQTFFDKLIIPIYPDEDGSVVAGTAFQYRREPGVHSTVSGAALSERGSSTLSTSSTVSRKTTTVLDTGGAGRRRRHGNRRQRRILNDPKVKRREREGERKADAEEFGAGGEQPTEQLAKGEAAAAVGDTSNTASDAIPHSDDKQRPQGEDSKVGSEVESSFAPSSLMSEVDDHNISPNDAADANDPGLPEAEFAEDEEVDICCGKHAWWTPGTIVASFDNIVELAEWDYEMKRVCKLALPFTLGAFLEGVIEIIEVALVANYLGTEAVGAYIIVETITGLTTEFYGGFLQVEATLCSHAIGAGNYRLAGQYVQISALLFSLCCIPTNIMWYFLIYDVILLFGFDEATAQMGQDYAKVYLFSNWLEGIEAALEEFLDVTDHEYWNMFFGLLTDTVDCAATACILILREDTTLQEVGLISLSITAVFFLFNCCYVVWKGWMNRYLDGMFGSIAFRNTKAVRNVIRTGIPLAFGVVIEYGEWEIMTIFAGFMGPAEVATWGILDTVWDTFEALADGLGDAGEVRVSFHLGNSNPVKAKKTSYKVIFLSLMFSSFCTSIFFMMGEDLATWLTPDPTLQHMIADLLPYVGVGNIALSTGAVSWALVGAQGRYRLATLIVVIFSWGCTMPLAALFTYGLKWNLEGIVAAIVLASSLEGTVLLYVLLRSDWNRLAKHIVELNEADEKELERLRAENGLDSDYSSSSSSDEDD